MVIIWTSPAVNDLRNVFEFSKKSHPEKYLNNLTRYVEDLKLNPRLGKIYTYVQETIVRQLIYKEHKIYYYVKNESIYILAVIHSREDTKQRIKIIKDKLNK